MIQKLLKLKKKITNHNHDKYIITSEFNNLVASVFNGRLTQVNLITKTDFDAKLSSLQKFLQKNQNNHLLKMS